MRQLLFYLLIITVLQADSDISAPLPSTSRQCPTVRVDCPTGVIEPGSRPVSFSAHVDGADPKPVLSYEWSVSAGKIIGGQGTTEILVDTAGTGGQAVTATVKVGGLSTGCDQGASCTMAIDGLILTRKFDEYGNITLRDEKARLANFAVQLRNEPGSEGYIFAYDKRAGGAQARATRAKKLLVSYDIAAERIVAVNGGYRQSRWVELFIAPVGAIPPKPMPDVPTHKAKASKGAVKRH